MLFPTIRFAFFFALVLPLSWLLMPRWLRWRLFMISASLLFYGAWNWRYIFLLLGSIVGNQIFANAIDLTTSDRGRRRWMTAAVVANFAALGWFKYAGFLTDNTAGLLRLVGIDVHWSMPNVVLPVGISFFTFQALSYVFDVGRGQLRPASLLDFAVYLSFFPQLVAGPIVRGSEFLPQLRTRRDPRQVEAGLAFWLIASGLFKKVVVATYLADRITDPLFAAPGQHGGFEALVGVYAYAVQIYADFSGYTDIAIGVALLLGFQFPRNFDAPYAAVSVADFWRRWHMTLSRWLRDYLYIPLGGNRLGRWLTYRNVVLTMLLGGLWHGSRWTFVLWGGVHGAALVIERAWRAWRGGEPTSPLWIRRLLTFHVVALAWLFFRAETIGDAFSVLGRVVAGSSSVAVNPVVVLVVAAAIGAQYLSAERVARLQAAFSGWSLPAQAASLSAVLVAIDVLGPTSVAPFIYYQF